MAAYDGVKYLYKFTLSGGRTLLEDFAFHLPAHGQPGAWMPDFLDNGVYTRHGYYGLIEDQLVDWTGPELWLIECAEAWRPDKEGDKMMTRRARLAAKIEQWTRASMVSFACDAAERSLPAFEKINPKDKRLRAALEAIRTFLKNPTHPGPMRDAAGEVEDAAKEAALKSYKSRCPKELCNAEFLDAARAARQVANIAKGAATMDVNDFRLFLVRPADQEERAWQLKRKLAYIKGENRG